MLSVQFPVSAAQQIKGRYSSPQKYRMCSKEGKFWQFVLEVFSQPLAVTRKNVHRGPAMKFFYHIACVTCWLCGLIAVTPQLFANLKLLLGLAEQKLLERNFPNCANCSSAWWRGTTHFTIQCASLGRIVFGSDFPSSLAVRRCRNIDRVSQCYSKPLLGSRNLMGQVACLATLSGHSFLVSSVWLLCLSLLVTGQHVTIKIEL